MYPKTVETGNTGVQNWKERLFSSVYVKGFIWFSPWKMYFGGSWVCLCVCVCVGGGCRVRGAHGEKTEKSREADYSIKRKQHEQKHLQK